MSALRVVLFVEGSHGSTRRGGGEWLDHLWLDLLAHQLGLRRAERVVPISKANLVALAAAQELGRRTSRIRVPLDELLKAEIERGGCDAAVVAWDLQPKWDTHPNACRLNETLDLFGLGTRRIKSWPKPTDWSLPAPGRGDALLQQAVLAAQRVRPQPAACRRIRGDMRTAKHEWAAHILASLSEKDRQRVRKHPIGARLREVLPSLPPSS